VNIFLYALMDAGAAAFLRGNLENCSLHWADKLALRPEDEARFQACSVCFGNVPAKWLARHPRLEWLQLESVGFEYYHGHEWSLTHPNLRVTNLRGVFDSPAAETAVAGLLHFVRGLNLLVPAQAHNAWDPSGIRAQSGLLADAQVIILGFGSVGRRVRRLLEAFGCSVRSFSRRDPEAEIKDRTALDAALPSADVLIGCLPHTSETEGMLDRRRLALLPPQAYLVNIGRGSLIDEAALRESLTSGRLRGAVLDVTREEPIPEDHPFWTCPNLLLTQHSAGGSSGELRAKAQFFVANFRRYEAGTPLLNLVSLQQGY